MDVIVVGGGVMGASVAYQLALRGRRCVVLEAETLAHGASGNAAGLVSPPRDGGSLGSEDPATAAAWFDMRKTTFEMHQELAETLPEQAGMDYGWTVKPSIGVAITEEEEGRARRELASMEAMGIPASWLTPAEIRAACPTFDGERIRGGVLSADPGTHPLIPAAHAAPHSQSLCSDFCGAQVEPALFTTALMRAAERLAGATIREGCRVAGLLPADGGEMPGVVLESGEKILGESVVLTMGPWAADAQPWLGTALPVTPLKGQILRYAPSDPAAKTHRAYRYEGHFYIGPQENGEVWVGTTEETVGFATHTTAAAVEHISELTEQISPSLVNADVVKQTAVRTRVMLRVHGTSNR